MEQQPAHQSIEIVLFSAFDEKALRARAQQLKSFSSSHSLHILASALARRPGLPVRGAIVASCSEELTVPLGSIGMNFSTKI